MNYREARLYLDEVSEYGSVLGLSRMKALLEGLNRPDRTCRMIHVAGTNGKGSVCAYLSSILQEAGYRVGRYISPAVSNYLEKFQINDVYMSEDVFGWLMDSIKSALENMAVSASFPGYPTVFEMETAIAFLYFARENCDYVILECGMGGEGDATNVIENPVLSIITHVDMDHMRYLGNTVEKIALSKAGIIKRGCPLVLAPQNPPIKELLVKEALKRGALEIQVVDSRQIFIEKRNLSGQCWEWKGSCFETTLLGDYQLENATTAVAAARVLLKADPGNSPFLEDCMRKGIRNTTWFGRFQYLKGPPDIILDGAHNPDGARHLRSSLECYFGRRKHPFIMGAFKDKDYRSILKETLPLCSVLYTIPLPDAGRSLSPGELAYEAAAMGVRAVPLASCEEALEKAVSDCDSSDDTIVIFGSLSHLATMYRLWRKYIG